MMRSLSSPANLLLVLSVIAATGCDRVARVVSGRTMPRESISYLATGYLSENGGPFIRSILDEVAVRTGTRVELRVESSWVRPDSTGKTRDILERTAPDLVLEAEPHAREWIERGYYAPLDELLPRLCPNVWKDIPQDTWDVNRVGGHIYGIPLDARRYRGYWLVRRDIRARLGIPEVESFPELVAAARVVAAARAVPKPILGDAARPLLEVRCRHDLDMRKTPAIDSLLLYFQGNDGIVHNLLDEMPADVLRELGDVRKWSRDGLHVAPRIGSQRRGLVDFLYDGDWFAAYVSELDLPMPVEPGPPMFEAARGLAQSRTKGAQVDVLMEQAAAGSPLVDLRSSRFLCIPAAGKKKDAVFAFLNAMDTRELHDLLNYGVQGTHWKAAGPDGCEEVGGYGTGGSSSAMMSSGMDKPAVTYTMFFSDRPFELVAPLSDNPAFLRVSTALPAAYRDQYLREMRREDAAQVDILAGFTFQSSAVWEQVYDYVAKYHAAYLQLAVGEVSLEPSWSLLRADAYDTVKAIQRELQRQIDAYLNRRGGR